MTGGGSSGIAPFGSGSVAEAHPTNPVMHPAAKNIRAVTRVAQDFARLPPRLPPISLSLPSLRTVNLRHCHPRRERAVDQRTLRDQPNGERELDDVEGENDGKDLRGEGRPQESRCPHAGDDPQPAEPSWEIIRLQNAVAEQHLEESKQDEGDAEDTAVQPQT